MAEAVADAIDRGENLLVEAGTGVGKSFAYLVPAIQAVAADKDCRVVVSTHTISLQEQLVRKDIPFLQSVMPDEFRPVLVKGRGNYLSLRRLRVAQQRMRARCSTDPAAADQLVQIGRWSRQTTDGSKRPAASSRCRPVWDLVESDSGNCLGPQVPAPRRLLLLQGPAGRRSGRTCSSSTTPCSSATWPCGGRGGAAAGLPGRHLRRGPHPRGRGRRPPRAVGVAGRRSSTCSTSSSPRGRTRGCSPPTATTTAFAQLEAARQAAEQFFLRGPLVARQPAAGHRPGPRAGHRAGPAVRGTRQAGDRPQRHRRQAQERRGEDRTDQPGRPAARRWPMAVRQWLGAGARRAGVLGRGAAGPGAAGGAGQRPDRGRPGAEASSSTTRCRRWS